MAMTSSKKGARQYRAALGLCSGLLIGGVPLAPVLAQDSAAVSQLVQQAQFWDAKQRSDLAQESWKRVLQADPKNAKALARLAEIADQNGQHGDAQNYLNQLQQVAPGSALTRRTQQQLQGGGGSTATLSRARALAQQGKAADAIKIYEQVYGGSTPPDDTNGLEYYETMAGIPTRYGEARDALAQLAQRNSGDARYALTYARVLSYRENTRRDAITRLRTLGSDGKYGIDAKRAWRQALVWLQATPADQPLYQDYLDTAGNDADIAQKLAALKEARAGTVAAQATQSNDAELARAFRNLDAGELDAAESDFERLIGKDVSSADARAGLGLVRLRQQRFNDARNLFDDAVRAKPSLEPRYREARRTALFWNRARNGQSASSAGNSHRAENEYAAALGAPPPGGAPSSIVRAYADALVANDKSALAEQKLRAALKSKPNDPELVSGLAAILLKSGRNEEAGKLLANAPEASRVQFRTAQAELTRQQAATLTQSGRYPEAEQKLREALTIAPESPWIRLDLARLYRRMGRDAEAESLLNAMVEASADSAQAYLAQAYAFTESQRWYEALLALEGLPPADRTPDARKLQREAWVRYQVQRATQAAQQGDASHAAEWLGAAVNAAGNDPSLASALAQGWASLGDPARAVAVLRRSFSARGEPSAGDRIQYAALLLQIDQDAEFEAVSTTLIQRGNMSPQQSKTLEELIVGYRIKLADRARERGSFAASYRQLREVVARYPNQPRVQMALARLFASAGEPEKSLAIGKSLMNQAKPSDEQLYAAIDSALAAKDKDSAGQWIDIAFKRGNDPVAAHRAAARLAELRGRQAEALGHYREADALAKQLRDYSAAPPELTLIDPSTGAASALPGPMRDMLQGTDVPVGPLLPRAPDAGTEAPLPATAVLSKAAGLPPAAAGSSYGGYQLSSALRRTDAKAVTSSDARYGAPVALQFDRRMHTPAPDSQWTAPFDAAQVQPMERLEGQVSGWTLGGFDSRSRNGEGGLGKLFDLETPIDWASRQWSASRIAVRIRPAYLDAGSVSGRTNLLKYGTLALVNGESENLDQSDSGIAIGAAYQISDFTADIGTTPLGFRVESLVGGLLWTPTFGDLSLTFNASRRAVTDSLLSYAGAYDPLTGRDWGGVTRSGGRIDAAYDFGSYGLYGNGGYYTLTGRNVAENTEFEFGGGLFVRAYRGANSTLTAGLNLTTFGYDKNLRYYSFGHGGYFSPQFFGAITLPAAFSGTYGSLSYRIDAAIGIQSFREDGTALYPNNGALQDEVISLADFEPAANIPTGYASQKNTGLGYRFGGAAQYRLTDHLTLGGSLGVDNARDYRELNLIGYLRYSFSGVQGLPEEPQVPNIFKGPLP